MHFQWRRYSRCPITLAPIIALMMKKRWSLNVSDRMMNCSPQIKITKLYKFPAAFETTNQIFLSPTYHLSVCTSYGISYSTTAPGGGQRRHDVWCLPAAIAHSWEKLSKWGKSRVTQKPNLNPSSESACPPPFTLLHQSFTASSENHNNMGMGKRVDTIHM